MRVDAKADVDAFPSLTFPSRGSSQHPQADCLDESTGSY